MAYEPKTEVGKKALANGADPDVVESQEKDGSLADEVEEKEKEESEHVEKKTEGDEKKSDKKEDDKSKASEDGEGDDKDDEEEDDDESRQPNREVKSMPAWKAKELAKEAAEKARAEARAEAEAEFGKKIADAAGKDGTVSDDDIKKMSEDLGLTPEVASAMVDRIAGILEKRAGLDDIRKTVESQKVREKELAEEQGFEKEWDSKGTQESLKTAAGNREITAEVRKKVKELAYTPDYARYRLSDIIRLEAGNLFGKKESRSAEGGRGTARGEVQKSIDEMTSDDIESMSDEEFLKFSNDLGKQGSRFSKSKKR